MLIIQSGEVGFCSHLVRASIPLLQRRDPVQCYPRYAERCRENTDCRRLERMDTQIHQWPLLHPAASEERWMLGGWDSNLTWESVNPREWTTSLVAIWSSSHQTHHEGWALCWWSPWEGRHCGSVQVQILDVPCYQVEQSCLLELPVVQTCEGEADGPDHGADATCSFEASTSVHLNYAGSLRPISSLWGGAETYHWEGLGYHIHRPLL